MKIEIFANGCGTGKTTRNKQIIKQHTNKSFLVIVPSINLANDYSTVGAVVTSQHKTLTTQDQLSNALDAQQRVIVTTHQTFLNCEFKTRLTLNRWVIQDEELKVYKSDTYKEGTHKGILDVAATALKTTVQAQENATWYEVTLNAVNAGKFVKNADWYEHADKVKDLIATPHKLWTNKDSDADERYLFAVVDPAVYAHADQVTITCSNFTRTQQYKLWMNLFAVEFVIVQPFVMYNTPNLTIYHAQQAINSITYNKAHPELRQAVVDSITTDKKVVYVDNNYTKKQTANNWTRCEHNCHGNNDNRDAAHIAFLSALNHSGIDVAFLKQVGEMSYDEISYAFTGELMHQVVMRGVLRDNNAAECSIYLMDKRLAMYAAGILFNGATCVEIDGTDRAIKAAPLTVSERNRARALKKALPELKNIDTRELMKLNIWQRKALNNLHN